MAAWRGSSSRRAGSVGAVVLHAAVWMGGRREAELTVESVRIARHEAPAAQARQVRIDDRHGEHGARQAPAAVRPRGGYVWTTCIPER